MYTKNGCHAFCSLYLQFRRLHWRFVHMQITWMVCRKFQFQAFNYVDKDGKGTLDPAKAVRITGATATVVSDHLAQLLITDGMAREGTCMPPPVTTEHKTFLTYQSACFFACYASSKISIMRYGSMFGWQKQTTRPNLVCPCLSNVFNF